MKDTYEDYVQPPSYIDSTGSEDPLISKLRLRIQKDLNQINGVYNNQIADSEKEKTLQLKQVESHYNKIIEDINKQRKHDIDQYNSQAEQRIDELISSINNYSVQQESWFKKLFNSLK